MFIQVDQVGNVSDHLVVDLDAGPLRFDDLPAPAATEEATPAGRPEAR